MKKIQLKKNVVVSLYITSFLLLLGSVLYMTQINKISYDLDEEEKVVKENNEVVYVEEDLPVIVNETNIMKPYKDEKVTIINNYYDYQKDTDTQQNSIIYYENTYIQNSGICYGSKEKFDVIAIADGEVTDVKEDELLGNIVEITHKNNIVSVYQSLGEVQVKKGAKITQGSIIGTSGSSNIEKDLGIHVHFELIIDGKNVNPEEFYGKNIDEV